MRTRYDIADTKALIRRAFPEMSEADLKTLATRVQVGKLTMEELAAFVEAAQKTVKEYWAQDFDAVRATRGILKEVWEARPYVRWPDPPPREISKIVVCSDTSAIRGAYWGLNQYQRAYMTKLANQSPGWVIMRHAVPGAPYVYAEARPDEKVETGPPVRHWHGTGEPPEDVLEPPGVQILPRGTEAFRQHCRKMNEVGGGERHEEREDVHEHPDKAKYIFPPCAKKDDPWNHDHDRGKSGEFYRKHPDALKRHIENRHKKNPELIQDHRDGTHTHFRRVKDRSNPLAKRLDIHPMALKRLADAEVVYFGLEGCLKADSILTAIIREDRKESVFSVPSVSLWDAPELADYADKFLKGKTVMVVPDADWVDKDLVIAHARFAQRFLYQRGISTYIAAPPLNDDGSFEHKGIDDFLGAGGSLDDLVVLERCDSPHLTATDLETHARRNVVHKSKRCRRSEAVDNDVALMMTLARFADSHGRVKATHKSLAKILGVDQSTVTRHLNHLKETRWIEVEKQVKDAAEEEQWEIIKGAVGTKRGYITKEGLYIYGPEEWRDGPRIIVPEQLRGTDHKIPLRDLLRRLGIRCG
jgi:DNA-binding transcriptional ArsR family regulator